MLHVDHASRQGANNMRTGLPSDWTTFHRRVPGTGRRLRVHCSRDDTQWAELAPAYWNDALPDIHPFRESRAARVHLGRIATEPLYFKRFLSRGASDVLKHLLRPSRAMRACIAGEALRGLGFRTPEPCCVIEAPHAGAVVESALITRAIEDTFNLYDWFHEDRGEIQEKRDLLHAYGTEIGRMHACGIFHGDMRKSNALCHAGEGPRRFYWLDNERTRVGRLSQRRRVKNLVQVNMERDGVTRTDRMRFWKAYVPAAGIDVALARALRRRVLEKTQKRWHRLGALPSSGGTGLDVN